MSLFQAAYETFESHSSLVGKEIEGHEILAPVSHLAVNTRIEICLEQDGSFSSASVGEKKIIIPVTEASAGRSGKKPKAHPLCDKLKYMLPDSEKYDELLTGLRKWARSQYGNVFIDTVLSYLEKHTVIADLLSSGAIELDKEGKLKSSDLESIVRWRVHGAGITRDGSWQQEALVESFQNYYRSVIEKERAKGLCMVSGEYDVLADQHAKGIVALHGNAKLISSNDSEGFTFRGRFTNEEQACTVSYTVSQKVHNVLKWLAAEQGKIYGGRAFVCWNPLGAKVCHAIGPFAQNSKDVFRPSDYREALKNTLIGWRSQLPEDKQDVIITAFDAATSGRLSIVYYNELPGSDYLQRLHDWDLHCCWYFGWERNIASPPLPQIVNCSYGTERTYENGKAKLETSDKLFCQQLQRLLMCRVDKARIPYDIVKTLANRASHPECYTKENNELILETTCAVIKKYLYDTKEEEWEMSLELDKYDRSYQFGCLLAVMEKAERDTYNKEEAREPNAMRFRSVFQRRPMYAAAMIQEKLDVAYFPRLEPGKREFYRKRIAEIMDILSSFPTEELNKPLLETYLMGYYLQRKALYTSSKETVKDKDQQQDDNINNDGEEK